ncbi:MAG TPA: M20/M25/M40 family metallo-hydrolase [Bacteroidales bacterium]|nr:M20/M25/M40 family metallo-hydrolase [Bacteroidales bacterium]HPJ59470.1 M20/M25/M40 family metallo-hydrolase [Bacteroidales bacterium]HPR12853.1 M20/M25/M40 family metallo-hydrolase [Bacteroidales bacterium]HRW85120.1 M20/M25/M40 family metallo-hydrolase [Bacteroidales bacterium]
MKIVKSGITVLLMLIMPLWLCAQTENVDLVMVYKIKQEGSRNSKIEDLAFGLTDLTGPRLTGSTGNTRGNEWAKAKMEELGFQNVRIEEAGDFTRGGWDNLKTYAAMTAPYYTNFACNPVAWTGSTNGLVKSEVVMIDVRTEADLEKYKGKLSGKIVMMPSATTTPYQISFEPLASRYTDEELEALKTESISQARRRGAVGMPADMATLMAQRQLRTRVTELLMNEGIAVILNNSGTYNIPRSNGGGYNSGDKEPVAQLNIPMEAFSRLERLLRNNVPVEMEVEIKNKFFASPKVYNVIGEIPGTDKALKDEVVLLGAHLDSWHGGTGAADNASGCIVMMEALRILKDLNVSPKRTIRVALWGGEEQGLYGSRGYVSKYLVDPQSGKNKPDFDKFAVYFNMDNGSGRYRGIYLQQNEAVRPVFEEWFKPFNDLGASTITIRNTSGTDHQSFDRYGLPAFQFIQDEIEYGRGYHTVMDTWERLVMDDLKINAIITASLAYNAAMRAEKLPRKPVMPQPAGAQGRPPMF